MSLFHRPNNHIKKIFFNDYFDPKENLYKIRIKIFNQLKLLYKNLHVVKNKDIKCTNLRSLFDLFDKKYKLRGNKIENIDWVNNQQEPSDVFKMLAKVLNIPDTIKIKINTSKGEETNEKIKFDASIMNLITLNPNNKINIKDYYPITNETFDKPIVGNSGPLEKFTKTTEIIDANLFVINIQRKYNDDDKIITPVIPEEYITLKNKDILSCTSILIHHGDSQGGHYTCMFKYFKDDKWWHFDDTKDKYDLIGDFKAMLKWKKGFVKKNMTNCVYLKL
jgi:hypothetical protein